MRSTVSGLPNLRQLPNLIVIGAMKCGTSAVHRYLDAHPDIAMSREKELNFFYGGDTGNWHRGAQWYAAQFPDAPVRGEASPGYTSPSYPSVASRMAALIPEARLVYLVRDPIQRAISQYRHHRAEGAEQRPVAEALLDPASQYIARGRYFERLEPFLDHYPREHILVVTQEALLTDRRTTVGALFGFAGVDDRFWSQQLDRRWHTARMTAPDVDAKLRASLEDALADDADRLRSWLGRDLPGWSV